MWTREQHLAFKASYGRDPTTYEMSYGATPRTPALKLDVSRLAEAVNAVGKSITAAIASVGPLSTPTPALDRWAEKAAAMARAVGRGPGRASYAARCLKQGMTPQAARDSLNDPETRFCFNIDDCRTAHRGNLKSYLAVCRYDAERKLKADQKAMLRKS